MEDIDMNELNEWLNNSTDMERMQEFLDAASTDNGPVIKHDGKMFGLKINMMDMMQFAVEIITAAKVEQTFLDIDLGELYSKLVAYCCMGLDEGMDELTTLSEDDCIRRKEDGTPHPVAYVAMLLKNRPVMAHIIYMAFSLGYLKGTRNPK